MLAGETPFFVSSCVGVGGRVLLGLGGGETGLDCLVPRYQELAPCFVTSRWYGISIKCNFFAFFKNWVVLIILEGFAVYC